MKQLNSVLIGVNAVEGLDPTALTETITTRDGMGNETAKTIVRTSTQISWFRAVYRTGRIAVSVREVMTHDGQRGYAATAEVYASASDPQGQYLANGTALRCYDPQNPSISPLEWSQTAAIGIALRNAGFGCQLECDLTGDAPQSNCGFAMSAEDAIPFTMDDQYDDGYSDFCADPNYNTGYDAQAYAPTAQAQPFGTGCTAQAYMPTAPVQPAQPVRQPEVAPQPPVMQPTPMAQQQSYVAKKPEQPVTSNNAAPSHEMTIEQAYAAVCPFGENKGMTLYQLLQINPNFVAWCARNKFDKPESQAFGNAAKMVCEYAIQQQS